MQHVRPGGARDVGAVVDGQQSAVPARRVPENLQRRQLLARLHGPEALFADRALVAQLDEVDTSGQRRVGELGKVAALAAGIGAEVEPGGGKTSARGIDGIRHNPRG